MKSLRVPLPPSSYLLSFGLASNFQIRLPVSVLYGDKDQVLDHAAQGLSLKESMPDVEIEILPGIGHMPQFVEPKAVADFVHRAAARAFAA